MKDFYLLFDKNHDLIYGMGEFIHEYILNLYFSYPKPPRKINKQIMGNTYPLDMERAHVRYSHNVINAYNVVIEPGLFKTKVINQTKKISISQTRGTMKKVFERESGKWKQSNPKSKYLPLHLNYDEELLKRYKEYYKALEKHVGYGPGSLMKSVILVQPDNIKLVHTLEKYQVLRDKFGQFIQSSLSTNEIQKLEGKISSVIGDLAIRGSCKFAIDFFVRQKSKSNIHYILDGMDMKTIVDGTMVTNEDTQEKKVPICTSEIRYLFRNWNKFKDTYRVTFYKDYDWASPPWYDTSDTYVIKRWAQYAVHRVFKYVKSIPLEYLQKYLKVSSVFVEDQDDWWKAYRTVRAFHEIPYQFVNRHNDEGEISPTYGSFYFL
jgi:hypothetical protein